MQVESDDCDEDQLEELAVESTSRTTGSAGGGIKGAGALSQVGSADD